MKTPEQLKAHFNRDKRTGKQIMLNIALHDILHTVETCIEQGAFASAAATRQSTERIIDQIVV